MGEKLVDYFARADALGGIGAKVRLAVLTRIPSTQVQTEPDSDANLEKFQKAFAQLLHEFAGGGVPGVDAAAALESDPPAVVAARLRRHNAIFLELMSQRSLFLGDSERTLARVTEAASSAL